MVHVNSMNQMYQIEPVCPMCGKLITICITRSADNILSGSENILIFETLTLSGLQDVTSSETTMTDSVRRRLDTSVGMGGIFTWSILLLTLVNGVWSQQSTRDFINGLEQSQMRYEHPERVRELASIFELIQQNAAAFQKHQQPATRSRSLNMIGAEDPELPSEMIGVEQQYENSNSMVPGPAMPLGMLIQNRELQNLIQQQEYNEIGRQDKRGSYMALCHFKICNMGRKRTSKWTPWLRNENV